MSRSDSEQRARILDAAIGVFAQAGFDGASIRRVGDAAGFNSALLYYYFEDKQTLYLEAMRRVVGDLLARLEPPAGGFKGGRERIEFLVDGAFDYYAAYPERLKLMSAVHTQHAEQLGRIIAELFRNRIPAPLRILREGVERGELRPLHPANIWWAILGTCVFTLHMQVTLRLADAKLLPLPLPGLERSRQDVRTLLGNGLAAEKTCRARKHRRSR